VINQKCKIFFSSSSPQIVIFSKYKSFLFILHKFLQAAILKEVSIAEYYTLGPNSGHMAIRILNSFKEDENCRILLSLLPADDNQIIDLGNATYVFIMEPTWRL
jgi:hypothetical protein